MCEALGLYPSSAHELETDGDGWAVCWSCPVLFSDDAARWDLGCGSCIAVPGGCKLLAIDALPHCMAGCRLNAFYVPDGLTDDGTNVCTHQISVDPDDAD